MAKIKKSSSKQCATGTSGVLRRKCAIPLPVMGSLRNDLRRLYGKEQCVKPDESLADARCYDFVFDGVRILASFLSGRLARVVFLESGTKRFSRKDLDALMAHYLGHGKRTWLMVLGGEDGHQIRLERSDKKLVLLFFFGVPQVRTKEWEDAEWGKQAG